MNKLLFMPPMAPLNNLVQVENMTQGEFAVLIGASIGVILFLIGVFWLLVRANNNHTNNEKE